MSQTSHFVISITNITYVENVTNVINIKAITNVKTDTSKTTVTNDTNVNYAMTVMDPQFSYFITYIPNFISLQDSMTEFLVTPNYI